MTFDPDTYGVMSHYTPKAQQRIRRTILEDWQASRVKLPTYMKLVARYIAPTGVPEDWLAKLSHQTMAKMLKSESTPRHTFWACLHIYITKKYGAVVIDEALQSASNLLGQAIAQFGTVRPVSVSGDITLGDNQTMIIEQNEAQSFATVLKTTQIASPPDSEMQIQFKHEGVAFETAAERLDSKAVFILRDCMTEEVTVELYSPADLGTAQL